MTHVELLQSHGVLVSSEKDGACKALGVSMFIHAVQRAFGCEQGLLLAGLELGSSSHECWSFPPPSQVSTTQNSYRNIWKHESTLTRRWKAMPPKIGHAPSLAIAPCKVQDCFKRISTGDSEQMKFHQNVLEKKNTPQVPTLSL